MPRIFQARTFARSFLIVTAIIFSCLLTLNLWNASAQSKRPARSLYEPVALPEGSITLAATAPLAPGNLVATQVNTTSGAVTLTWTDNSDNETGFKVETSADGTSWSVGSTTFPANSTSAAGFGANSGSLNYFRIRAINGAGTSAYSNVASPPLAQIVAPDYGQGYVEPGNVSITAIVNAPVAITKVEFFYRPEAVATSTPISTSTGHGV
jgi:hypothetical protein